MSDACKVCGAELPASKTTGRVSKWTVIKAQDEGWFFQKNGDAYCPKHVPGWVAGWRANQ